MTPRAAPAWSSRRSRTRTAGRSSWKRRELVHRFALDILAASDQQLLPGMASPSAPAWAVEGFAVALEAAYDSNTNPAPDEYSFKALNDAAQGAAGQLQER